MNSELLIFICRKFPLHGWSAKMSFNFDTSAKMNFQFDTSAKISVHLSTSAKIKNKC